MSDAGGAVRRYSDEEIGRILRRATEIQVAEPTSAVAGGMTLQELEEIALEAGIDPRHLRRAALEVEGDVAEASLGAAVTGAPLDLRFEAAVPGALSAAGFERVVSVIQQTARDHGHASLVGTTLTWQGESSNGSPSTQVVVTSRDGETRIVVEERLHEVAKQLFGGLVGGVGTGVGVGVGVGVGIGALGSALFATLFPIGALTVSYIVAREAYRSRQKGRQRSLTALVERLSEEVTDCVAAASLEAAEPSAALPRG